jgi:hypothetical protein
MTSSYDTTDTRAPSSGATYNGRSRLDHGVAHTSKKDRPMWRAIVIAGLAWCLGLPAAPSHAGDSGAAIVVAQRGQEREAQRREGRREEQRERRRESDRPQREYLTPDEHRELNRDLQRANREIYRKGRDRR